MPGTSWARELALVAEFARQNAAALSRRYARPVQLFQLQVHPVAHLNAHDLADLGEPVSSQGEGAALGRLLAVTAIAELCHNSGADTPVSGLRIRCFRDALAARYFFTQPPPIGL